MRPEELSGENYVSVGAQRSGFTKNIEDVLLRGRGRAVVRSVPTLESLFLRVSSGGCVSLVPRPIAMALGRGCACVELEGVDTGFDVVAVWRQDNIAPALQAFTALF